MYYSAGLVVPIALYCPAGDQWLGDILLTINIISSTRLPLATMYGILHSSIGFLQVRRGQHFSLVD